MKPFPEKLQQKLDQRLRDDALRKIPTKLSGVDFSSNDYLGFARDKELYSRSLEITAERGLCDNGSTGSRLLTGNHRLYSVAESLVSRFHQMESALIFPSGYVANLGLLSAVVQKEDVVLYDEYIHASSRDGLKMVSGKSYKFRHNDPEDLSKKLKQVRAKSKEIYILTESVFSMDGDLARLPEIAQLSRTYGARLIVDEAHAVGCIGNKGAGLVNQLGLQKEVFALVITFGKAIGAHGAAILGCPQLREFLVNFSRSFIFTTALSPHTLASVIAAYEQLEQAEFRGVEQLQKRISFFLSELDSLDLADDFVTGPAAVQSCIIPGNSSVKAAARALAEAGFNLLPILAPTVPAGKERLRICLHSFNTVEQITAVLQIIRKKITT